MQSARDESVCVCERETERERERERERESWFVSVDIHKHMRVPLFVRNCLVILSELPATGWVRVSNRVSNHEVYSLILKGGHGQT